MESPKCVRTIVTVVRELDEQLTRAEVAANQAEYAARSTCGYVYSPEKDQARPRPQIGESSLLEVLDGLAARVRDATDRTVRALNAIEQSINPGGPTATPAEPETAERFLGRGQAGAGRRL